ncbi:hypothetical protein CHARACLAT_032602 [Characodon lateralis]|uniref:Uncharacterized protein n=1 Tax=Characodon lateralis TaxID=208331 RepID=A0ABU7D2J6_9TELE|nr:hypothetical protein [Characodon lateralis]
MFRTLSLQWFGAGTEMAFEERRFCVMNHFCLFFSPSSCFEQPDFHSKCPDTSKSPVQFSLQCLLKNQLPCTMCLKGCYGDLTPHHCGLEIRDKYGSSLVCPFQMIQTLIPGLTVNVGKFSSCCHNIS